MKSRYEVDENNRLVITTQKKGKEKETSGLDGRFVVDDKNRLSYILSEPKRWRKKFEFPKKITFQGIWSIDTSHNLLFTLNKTTSQVPGDRLYLKTELVSVESNAIVFALATRHKSGIHRIRLLQLRGRWQADRYNRLCFLAQKTQSRYETFTLKGMWEVNKNNKLIYRYKKTYLKRKPREEKTIIFKGFWTISQKDRLTYILDMRNNSYFSFRVQAESPSLIGKRGTIKYRVGIGTKRELFKSQIITLYGVWKFGRGAKISFEIDYGDGRIQQIQFGASIYITKKDKVLFQLKNREGEDLGVGVIFSRKFLESNAHMFLRLKKMDKDSRIEGGITIPW